MYKQWKVTYEILFTSENEPSRFSAEFIYFETAMMFIKNTEVHQNLIFATIERISHK